MLRLTPHIRGAEIGCKRFSILPGTVPRVRCFLLSSLAVARVLSQERESKIVGQRVGIPGIRSGNRGSSAAYKVQL